MKVQPAAAAAEADYDRQPFAFCGKPGVPDVLNINTFFQGGFEEFKFLVKSQHGSQYLFILFSSPKATFKRKPPRCKFANFD